MLFLPASPEDTSNLAFSFVSVTVSLLTSQAILELATSFVSYLMEADLFFSGVMLPSAHLCPPGPGLKLLTPVPAVGRNCWYRCWGWALTSFVAWMVTFWGEKKGVWRSASHTESRGNNYCLTSMVACSPAGLEIKSLPWKT